MIYRFGAYELDDSARELRQDGERVETEPKAFELLLYLARNCDRAVSKDELLAELWPQQIVTETALTRCVMKARRAVGDDSGTQSVIRTLHSHGYRFVATLEPEPMPQIPADAPAPPRRSARLPLIGSAAVVLALLVGWFVVQQNPARASVGTVAVLPVTNLVEDAELSWVRVGMMSLMVRMLEEGGLEVADEDDVLRAVHDVPLNSPPDADLFDRIRREADADTVIYTVYDTRGGLGRLVAVITHGDGRRTRRMIVGDSPAALAAELSGVITGLLSTGEPVRPDRFAKVSTDPFVNELYARALDLELQGELEEARELFRVAASQEPELFWLRYEIALCTRDLREWEEAERMFAALYEEAKAGGDPRALVVTLNSHGILKLRRNEYLAAEPLFLRALAIAEESGRTEDRYSVLTNLGLISRRLGKIDEARSYYERLLGEFEAAGDQPSPFFHNNYAGLLLEQGDLETALEHSKQAIEGFRLRGQRRYEAPALNRMAKILRQQGDYDGAIARHAQALAIYRDLDNVVGELSVLLSLTSVYRETGELTRARNNVRTVLDRSDEHGNELLLADAHMQAAYVARDFRDHEAALTEFETALGIFHVLLDDEGLQAAMAGVVATAIELGDLSLAKQTAEDLHAYALAANNDVAEARAQWLLGMVAEAGGDSASARSFYEHALAYARANEDSSVLTDAGASLAALELSTGDSRAAAALVEEIRPHTGFRHDFARLEAQVAQAEGDAERARTILAELRSRAGQAWTPEDDALLAGLEGS